MKYSICLLILFIPSILTAAENVVLWERNYIRKDFKELVELLLELTKPTHGDYYLYTSEKMEQGRAFADISRGLELDIFIAGTSKEREALLPPIYFPVDRGLLGFRLCMIRREQQKAFIDVNTLSDFRRLDKIIGQGTHWPDRNIIESNGLRVLHSVNYESLFDMLRVGRFDCFLRSISEIDRELIRQNDQLLIPEPYVAMIYPSADFIFVSPAKPGLKKRLEVGLQLARENGDYDRHFKKLYYHHMQKYQFYRRKLLFLRNNDMTEEALDAINSYGIASFAQ